MYNYTAALQVALGHSVLGGSRVVGPPPIPNKSRFALRRVISRSLRHFGISIYTRIPICRIGNSIDRSILISVLSIFEISWPLI